MTMPIECRTTLQVHSLKDEDDLALLRLEAGLTVRHLETHHLPGFGDVWKHVFLVVSQLSRNSPTHWVTVNVNKPDNGSCRE
jgi:hypothetical protein